MYKQKTRSNVRSFFAGIAGALFVFLIFGLFSGIKLFDRELGSPLTCTAWQYIPFRFSTDDASVIENCTNPAVLSLTVYYTESGSPERQTAYGSGFYVTSDGYIVTSAHVVAGNNVLVRVQDYNGNWHGADVIAQDDDLDIALLRTAVTWTPYLKLADSQEIDLGETVYAFGNALGEYDNSITKGIVSGLNRKVGDIDSETHVWKQLIQTDAGISSGNSGGPLVDSYGRVAGVSTATSEGADNVSFAVTANEVRRFLDKYLK